MDNFWEWKSPGYRSEWWIDEPNTRGGRKRRQLLNTRERETQRKRERKGDSSSSVNGSAIVGLGGYAETDSIQTGTAGSTEKLLAVSSHGPDWHNGKNDWQILYATITHTHTVKSPAEWIRPHNGALYPLWYASERNHVHFHFFKTASSIIAASAHAHARSEECPTGFHLKLIAVFVAQILQVRAGDAKHMR